MAKPNPKTETPDDIQPAAGDTPAPPPAPPETTLPPDDVQDAASQTQAGQGGETGGENPEKLPETPPTDIPPAETLQFRTASGATFWRCGVQFDGEWKPLNRADFDDAQWARLLDEPMLQHQGA